jgi:hypothetical protein
MSSLSDDNARFFDFFRSFDLFLRLLFTGLAESTDLTDFTDLRDFCDLTDFGDLAMWKSGTVFAKFRFSSKPPRLLVSLLRLRCKDPGVPKMVRSLTITGLTLSETMSYLRWFFIASRSIA